MKRSISGGFTIVETLIVLSVTGVLFISLVGVMRGQQAKAQFRASVTDITTQIQSNISEVSTGFYPKGGDFKCSAAGGKLSLTNAQTSGLGENQGCTYLGQAVMFGVPGTDPEEYKLQTLVGLRATLAGAEPKSLREADTQVLMAGVQNNTVATWPRLSTTKNLQYGTEVAWMRARSGNTNIAGFAVVASPNQELKFTGNDQIESGSLIPVIIPIPNPNATVDNPGVSDSEGVDLILRSLGSPTNPGPGLLNAEALIGPIDICFSSGTTDQSALVTIGSGNSTTSVEFVIRNTRDCS